MGKLGETSSYTKPAEVKQYVNFCINEICSIEEGQSYNDILNQLTEARTIDEAFQIWKTTDPTAFATEELYNTYIPKNERDNTYRFIQHIRQIHSLPKRTVTEYNIGMFLIYRVMILLRIILLSAVLNLSTLIILSSSH